MKDILSHKVDISSGVVISYMEEAEGSYKDIATTVSADLFSSYDKDAVNDAINNPDKSFLVLDDCLYGKSDLDTEFTSYLTSGKSNALCIISSQCLPSNCINCDYIFIGRYSKYSGHRKELYELYGGAFESFEQFWQIIDSCTVRNFEFAVIDIKSKSEKLEDVVFCYKANLYSVQNK